MSSAVSKELRLVVYCVGLYATFMVWAFLQERITSTKYELLGDSIFWEYPVALNLAMAAAAYLTSLVIEYVQGEPIQVPALAFWLVNLKGIQADMLIDSRTTVFVQETSTFSDISVTNRI